MSHPLFEKHHLPLFPSELLVGCVIHLLLTSIYCLLVGRTPLLCRIIRFKCFSANCIISHFPCFQVASFPPASSEPSAMVFSLPMSPVQDYLHSLGKARTAQVQKDARIGEAQYKRDAVIRVNDQRHHFLLCLCLDSIHGVV